MYLQITDRCNMTCAHCCMDAQATGQDMSLKTFRAALQEGDYITLGGGEPTIHPQFEKMLLLAIATCESVHIITNGKHKERALLLAKLARAGVIGAELSQDPYHEEIDEAVIQAFTRSKPRDAYNPDNDLRGIRDTSQKLLNAGRCDWVEDESCCCEEEVVTPAGDIKPCGCLGAPVLASVKDRDSYEKVNDWYENNGLERGECYKKTLDYQEAANNE